MKLYTFRRGGGIDQELRQAFRAQGAGIKTGYAHLGFDEQLRGRDAVDLLQEVECRTALPLWLAGDLDLIIEARRGAVVNLEADDAEEDARICRQRRLRVAEGAQPLGARAFEEAQVVGVVDDRPAVRVLPVDTRAPCEHPHCGSSNSCRVALTRSGALRPKCRYAVRVTMRPRAVRIRKPCWMRKGSVTSSSVPRSSPSAAARLSMPTGPPSKRSMIASRSLRSSVSKPSRSTSRRSSAAFATASSMRPSARTWAKSRTRRSRRFAMRGVPRERCAMRV